MRLQRHNTATRPFTKPGEARRMVLAGRNCALYTRLHKGSPVLLELSRLLYVPWTDSLTEQAGGRARQGTHHTQLTEPRLRARTNTLAVYIKNRVPL